MRRLRGDGYSAGALTWSRAGRGGGISAAVCVVGLMLASCGSSPSTSSTAPSGGTYPLSFKQCDTTLTFKEPPKRVLVDYSLAANMVAPAGGNMTGKIVGLAAAGSDPIGPYAATLQGVPQMDPNQQISKEAIVGLHPDVVITHSLSDPLPQQLATLGIQTMVVNVCCDGYADQHGGHVGFDSVYDDVSMLGHLLGTDSYANQSIAHMKATVAHVTQQARRFHQQSMVMAGFFHGGFTVYGAKSIADTMIHTLGMTDAFGDISKRTQSINIEEMIRRNPETIVLGYFGNFGQNRDSLLQQFNALPGVNQLSAVRNHHVITIDLNYLVSLPITGVQMLANDLANLQ